MVANDSFSTVEGLQLKDFSNGPKEALLSAPKGNYAGTRRISSVEGTLLDDSIHTKPSTINAWLNIKHGTNNVLRALGLGLLSSFKPVFQRDKQAHRERTKIAIRKNRSIALLRSLIHILPVGISLWLISLNWTTYYVGSFIYDQIYYQVGAKAIEILIQASLAASIMAYVRYELVLGKGLPFGALFSGLQINQIGYLWSMEFWGSVGSPSFALRRRIMMLVLILVVFILAAAAGPSSAILLIPRRDYWPAGSTHIWINGSISDIWPSLLDGSNIPESCSATQEATVSDSCPSSEWQIVKTYLQLVENSLPKELKEELDVEIPPTSVEFTGKTSLRQTYLGEAVGSHNVSGREIIQKYITATTQVAVIADALVSTGAMWHLAVGDAQLNEHGAAPSDQQAAVHAINTDYYQPYVMAQCTFDAINGSADQRAVSFPTIPIPGTNFSVNTSETGDPVIDYPSLLRAQLLDLPGSNLDYRTTWVDLPQAVFKYPGLGAVVVYPPNSVSFSGNPSLRAQEFPRQYVVCNLGAGWGSSFINITELWGSLSATTSSANVKRSRLSLKAAGLSHVSGRPISSYESLSIPAFYDAPAFPEKSIEITSEWAKYLDPQILSLNTTVINVLLQSISGSFGTPNAIGVQTVLAPVLANGLARVGYDEFRFQGAPRTIQGPNGTTRLDGTYWLSGKGDFFSLDVNNSESENWLKLRVTSTLEGYAYNTSGASPKIAIAFLLSYCVLALISTLYAGICGISSTAWDSIAEVTALAMNSSPTSILQNTCAGISELQTFKTTVRVLVRRDKDEGDGEHLELSFGIPGHGSNSGAADNERDLIQANRTYGTVPAILTEKAASCCGKKNQQG